MNTKSLETTKKKMQKKSYWYKAELPAQYGKRKHAVIAVNKQGKRILISYKNAEKQGLQILRFAVKEEISFIR